LTTVEEVIGEPMAGYFDLIIDTSTGGIIAIGLGLGLPAREIYDFYIQRGLEIFAGNRYTRLLRQLGRAKYNREPLEPALRQHRPTLVVAPLAGLLRRAAVAVSSYYDRGTAIR
jgi:patatin-like phospholipase/acyl hydrolase